MDLAKHCRICENQVLDLQTGTYCGLTQKKPDFEYTCPSIKFAQKLEERIQILHTEFELVKKTKFNSYGNFVFFIVLAISVMIGGYLLGVYAFEAGVISTVPLIVMGVGVMILPFAFGPLNNYRQKMGVAQQRINELKKLMEMYNVKYDIEVKVKKDIHGNNHVTTNLNFLQKDR